MPGPNFAIYYATKAYVLSFSEALTQELRASGVKVSCLCPGPVETGFQARSGFALEGKMGVARLALVSPAEVARQGYEGLMANRRVIVPGLMNQAIVVLARLFPRAWLLPLLATSMDGREKQDRSIACPKLKEAETVLRESFFGRKGRASRGAPLWRSGFFRLQVQHLPAAIHAGLEVDVMGTAQLAGILVLDIRRGFQRVGGAAETTLHRRGFSLRNSHLLSPLGPRTKGPWL